MTTQNMLDSPEPFGLSIGGTGTSLVASAGGIVWSDSTKLNILSGTVTAGRLLLSGNAATPSWLATANDGVLITSHTGVPSWLANGTTGQVITATTGAPPSWSTISGTGNWIKISRQVASGSASIVFSGLTTTYQSYAVTFSSVIPETDSVNLLLTYNAIAANYVFAMTGYLSVGSVSSGSSESASAIRLNTIAAQLTNAANGGLGGLLYMHNPDTANNQIVTWQVGYLEAAPLFASISGAGYNTGTTPVTSITFAMSSGNIASGVIELYGLTA